MKITFNFCAFFRTRWYEYLSRFLIGGATTTLTGIIAKKFGPEIGGLFLAFPAIFPAGATLIEKHEKKQQAGGQGILRGRKAAALDAAGATLGSFGLMAFALVVWKLIPRLASLGTLSIATLAWFAIAIFTWKLWQNF
jgi:Protein of unknown function (DUF3147)